MLILSMLTSASLYAQQDDSYIVQLNKHRNNKDREFKDTATSILPKEMALTFKYLNYFEPNPAYRVLANFKKEIGKEFYMTTSSGQKKKFRQYGILYFELTGKSLQLPIYQNIRLMKTEEYKDYIFIPFTDLTSGEESYGGGRYIEASLPTDSTYSLDFNYCFNPYCHYTTGYNCPIPPAANFLDVRIEAGEKKYHTDKH